MSPNLAMRAGDLSEALDDIASAPQVFAGGDILRFVAKVGRVPALEIPQLICVSIRLWQVSPMPPNLLAAFDDPQAFPLEPVPFPARDEPTPEALPLAVLLQIERTV